MRHMRNRSAGVLIAASLFLLACQGGKDEFKKVKIGEFEYIFDLKGAEYGGLCGKDGEPTIKDGSGNKITPDKIPEGGNAKIECDQSTCKKKDFKCVIFRRYTQKIIDDEKDKEKKEAKNVFKPESDPNKAFIYKCLCIKQK